MNKEVESADQLLEPRPSNVPPQLLLALEKDRRSLARGYESARGVSETILRSLREHRDSYKVREGHRSRRASLMLLFLPVLFKLPSLPSSFILVSYVFIEAGLGLAPRLGDLVAC